MAPKTLTNTVQHIEKDLKATENDIGLFIKSQRNNLRKEKLQFEINKPYAQEGLRAWNRKSLSPPVNSKELEMGKEEYGLNLGGYEIKQQKLREERHREYKQYLEEQSKRGWHSNANTVNRSNEMTGAGLTENNTTSLKHVSSRDQNRKDYKTGIDNEYSVMLKSKKNEESLYRINYDVANDSTELESKRIDERHKDGKKMLIEFDDSDDELFKYVLQEKEKSKKQHRRSASDKIRNPKVKNDSYANSDDNEGRPSSVPPPNVPYIFGGSSHANVRNIKNREHKEALEEQIKEKQFSKVNNISHEHGMLPVPTKMPYVFGGSSHTMMRRQRNIEHKQALEEQIKEKEDTKNREKLKRIGKITQKTMNQSHQYPSNIDMEISEVLNKDVTKFVKTDQLLNKYSNSTDNLNYKGEKVIQLSGNDQGNFSHNYNNAVGYPNHHFGVNPMYNPMMMNYPLGWPGYGAMMSNGYAQNNMVQLPQGSTNMHQMDANNKMHPKNNDRSYVPSAIDKIDQQQSRKIRSPVINHVSNASSNEPDLSVKRAQQMAYQNELKKQMEIKKATAEKDKQEREKYEMKLENEIATYDPWGKSGCGAPVRTNDGKIVADLKKFLRNKEGGTVSFSMDLKNVEENLSDDLSPLLRALEVSQKGEDSAEKDKSLEDDNLSPSHKRGASLKELQGIIKSPRDKKEQDSYKEFLQQQVEEKKRKEEELKEKALLEELKENKRLSMQQQRMQEEYEEEKEKQRRKAEEFRQENEARALIAEQKRLYEEQKIKQIENDRDADKRKEAELKLGQGAGTLNGIVSTLPQRSQSPPVPGVVRRESQKKVKQYDAVIQNEKNSETMRYLNTIRENLNMKDKETEGRNEIHDQANLIRQLSALRKELMKQEEKVQSDLERNKKKYSTLVPDDNINKRSAFERATSVKSDRKQHDSGKPSILEQLIYDHHYNKDQIDLDTQQQEYMRQQEMRLLALRQGVENRSLLSEFQLDRQTSKQSLLECDSKFFSIHNCKVMDNNIAPKDCGPGYKETNLQNKVSLPSNFASNASPTDVTSVTASMSTLQVEDIARKNKERLASLNQDDIGQKNKERLNMLEQDEGGGSAIENSDIANEDNDKINEDNDKINEDSDEVINDFRPEES